MGNVNRYRKGALSLITVPVASATVIDIGDFIHLKDGLAVPSSGVTVTAGAKVTTQDTAADTFLGIAHSASASGETDDVLVDVSLESQYEIALATDADLSIGDQLEIYADDTSSACLDQKMVAGTTNPVMVCVNDSASGTRHLAKIVPTVLLHPKQS